MTLITDLLGASHRKYLRVSGSCSSCPRKRIGFTPASLKTSPVIFVTGEPGKKDVTEQELLSGSTGEYLRRILEENGISDFSVTSALHCPKPSRGASDKKNKKSQSCCLSQFVLDEIRGYPWVVLIGALPIKALFPGLRANRLRGNVTKHPDFPGQNFFTIYDPGYILRDKQREGEFVRQIQRLRRLIAGEGGPDIEVLHGGSRLYWDALEAQLEAPLISLDVETNTLESWSPGARIESIALTADAKTVCYAEREEEAFFPTLEKVKQFLLNPRKSAVGANVGFDLDFLERELGFRIALSGIHDVATIWYEVGGYTMPSLKELVAKELDGYRFLSFDAIKESDPHQRAMYNAEDAVYALELFWKGLAKAGVETRDLLTRVSGPSSYILRKLSTNGFYVRRKYLKGLKEDYEKRKRKVLLKWREEDPHFIPTQHERGKGLQKYLFSIKQLPPSRQTKTGKFSTDDSAIKKWIREEDADYLQHLLDLRRLEKIESTYLRGIESRIGKDSRVHPSFTITFTDTGRSSARKPNSQNIVRVGEIRDVFGAPPGQYLMESDFSQVEFRIMVCLAQDLAGIEAYQSGIDAHTLTAQSFASDPTKEHRTWAKVINFSLLYGGDAYKVQQWAREQYGLDWSYEKAQEFVEIFFSLYPRIAPFHRECDQKLIDNRGHFLSATGHNFHYRDWDHPDQGRRDHAFRAHINAHAQGPAAQITFLAMFWADRILKDKGYPEIKMVNTVHDSILTEIPEKELIPIVKESIEEGRDIAYEWVKSWLVVPLEMEHEVGPSWGSLKEVA